MLAVRIKDSGVRQGHASYAMEYFDFPDEKVGWMRLYEKPHIAKGGLQQNKLQLMIRPCFPKSYLESEAPNLDNISEVVVVYRDTWKVGDHVDWWYEGCYWTAQITDLIGSDKVQVALLEPPLGEGGSYEALCKDLRPSLDWSPDDGWTVPKAKEENEATAPCALLVIPFKKDSKDASNNMLQIQGVDGLEEDEKKKQSCTMNMTVSLSPSAKIGPLHQMLQDNLRKVEPLEQASYTKENVEEKLPGKEGAQARFKDGVDGLEEDEKKKQTCTMNMTVSLSPSAKIGPLHQMLQDNLRKVEPLEQASYTKENVEEKLLGKEGAQARFKDGKIGHDVAIPTAGQKMEIIGYTKENVEEKLLGKEGAQARFKDGKIGHDVAIPTAGQKMEIIDHDKLILPKKRVRNGISEIPQDHTTSKSSVIVGHPILHEERREANDVPEKGSCTKNNSDFKDLSNRSTIWRTEELNLTIYPDTVESSMLAIEELINKIKWVNEVLQFGMEKASSKKASWQFLDSIDLSCWNDASSSMLAQFEKEKGISLTAIRGMGIFVSEILWTLLKTLG
ncbi:hypothetical protein EJ110_NYTH28759 [Nymphaea thermarum]|nr:hypothetical protein EJ110_NYTH28759 [Nymphaea thermarum]